MITVIGVNVGEKPRIIEIDGSLNSLQEYVGGWIEAVYPFEDEVAIVCNEEGKIMGLEQNRFLMSDNEVVDVICGNFLIVGLGEEDFESLSDRLAAKYLEKAESKYIEI